MKTWIITDSASITKIPPIRSSRNSVFVMIAKPASAPPIAIEPVSPMKTSAGKALYQRKPTSSPDQRGADDRQVEVGVTSRWPGAPERMYAITVIAVKVKTAMIPVPAASPSIPSVRFTPFAAPAMIRNRNGYQA